jgi:protein transport protein HofC
MLAVQSYPYILGAIGPILLGVALLVVLRLLDDSKTPDGDVGHELLVVGAWTLIGIGLLAVGTVGSGGFPGFVALVVLGMVFYRRRRSEQQAFLWALAVAAERMMPLVPVVEAFAEERRGLWTLRSLRFTFRVRRLAELLRAGTPLPQALRQCPGLVPPEALASIEVGHQSGNLAAALRQAAETRDSQDVLWHQMTSKVVYLCVLTLFLFLIGLFMAVKIAPAFMKIFKDFDSELPAITQWTYAAMEIGGTVAGWTAPLMLALLCYTILRYMGRIRFGLPGLNWLTRRLETARILDALSLVAQQQRPLVEGIATLAQSYPKYSIRRRLGRVAKDVTAGTDWGESLVARGLIQRADWAVLQSAQRVGNLPWAMREMADSHRRRLAYRVQALLQTLFPMFVLLYGVIVGVFFVAYFLPLIALIQRLV